MKIKCLIVEDEKHCAERLELLLKRQHKDTIELVETAKDLRSAENMLGSEQIDLVFMDIEVGNENSIDLLRKLPKINFDIIFTTAHQEYAIHAIKMSALDYLLKPIDSDELADTLLRLLNRKNEKTENSRIGLLLQQLDLSLNKSNWRITIPTAEGFEVLRTEEILRCQADVNYTHIHLVNRKKITVAKTLKEFEGLLKPYGFFRTHNSHLVNLNQVIGYHKGKGGYLILRDKSEVEVSQRRKEELLKTLKDNF
ncbi:LytR/AlgR family response regulator transcription factor [Algoriphagus sp.]|uniref:LytR/AlgR family response regulator transcription factor n=1 Tax=Algoriphagus sp. TaxID=1872435 RepID=UPI003F6FC0EE